MPRDLNERHWSAAVSQTSRSFQSISSALRAGNVLRLGFATAAVRWQQPHFFYPRATRLHHVHG
jgi:hypothetical protein